MMGLTNSSRAAGTAGGSAVCVYIASESETGAECTKRLVEKTLALPYGAVKETELDGRIQVGYGKKSK